MDYTSLFAGFAVNLVEVRVFFDEPRAERGRASYDATLADEPNLAVDNA